MTEVVVQTVTKTLVAIGGIIQNVQVSLDNGNGNTWSYSTRLVTGESVITVLPTTFTECATIYVYGDTTLTTETTLITPPGSGSGQKILPSDSNLNDRSKDQQYDIHDIVKNMMIQAANLDHLGKRHQPSSKEYEEIVSI